MGLSGNDQSGLAKRVALAFDEDPQLDDIDTLCTQTGSVVVLKGRAPSQNSSKMISAARGLMAQPMLILIKSQLAKPLGWWPPTKKKELARQFSHQS